MIPSDQISGSRRAPLDLLGLPGSLLLALLLLVPLGCSFSASSESFSESSASSSRSSSPKSAETEYLEDARDYTAGYVKSGGEGQFDAFQKKLGDLAKQHGITNWEDDLITYTGIGEGLGQAGASQSELEGFMDNLARTDSDRRQAMQKGFDSTKK